MSKEKEKMMQRLQETFPELTCNMKENEIIASAKSLTLSTRHLQALARITEGYSVTFGRTGANFRMIIS